MPKDFLRFDAVNTPPAVGNSAFSWVEAPRGNRIIGANWQSTLPAGATVQDCHGSLRVTIGSPIIDVDVDRYDRFRAVLNPAGGILSNVPGEIADIPLVLAELERSSPFLAESSAIDLPPAEMCAFDLPKCILELQYKNRAATVPAIGCTLIAEPLADIHPSEWNVVWNTNDGRYKDGARVINLKVPKVRSSPLATNGNGDFVQENFQSFFKDELDAILYTQPTGAVLNQVILEVDGKQRFRWTKKENDNLLRRAGLNPGADFVFIPTISDRNSDTWKLIGRNVKQFLKFAAALGGPGAAVVNPTSSIDCVTFHRGLLIG